MSGREENLNTMEDTPPLDPERVAAVNMLASESIHNAFEQDVIVVVETIKTINAGLINAEATLYKVLGEDNQEYYVKKHVKDPRYVIHEALAMSVLSRDIAETYAAGAIARSSLAIVKGGEVGEAGSSYQLLSGLSLSEIMELDPERLVLVTEALDEKGGIGLEKNLLERIRVFLSTLKIQEAAVRRGFVVHDIKKNSIYKDKSGSYKHIDFGVITRLSSNEFVENLREQILLALKGVVFGRPDGSKKEIINFALATGNYASLRDWSKDALPSLLLFQLMRMEKVSGAGGIESSLDVIKSYETYLIGLGKMSRLAADVKEAILKRFASETREEDSRLGLAVALLIDAEKNSLVRSPMFAKHKKKLMSLYMKSFPEHLRNEIFSAVDFMEPHEIVKMINSEENLAAKMWYFHRYHTKIPEIQKEQIIQEIAAACGVSQDDAGMGYNEFVFQITYSSANFLNQDNLSDIRRGTLEITSKGKLKFEK